LAAVAGINDTGGQLASRVIDNGGAPKIAKISVNFRKNSKWRYLYYQVLEGRH
jgi:hypothetical protein